MDEWAWEIVDRDVDNVGLACGCGYGRGVWDCGCAYGFESMSNTPLVEWEEITYAIDCDCVEVF